MYLNTRIVDSCAIASVPVETLDSRNFSELREDLTRLAKKHRNLVLDLGALQYVDSTALGMFISLAQTLNDKGGSIVLCRVNSMVRNLLSIVRLDHMFKVVDSQPDALEALGIDRSLVETDSDR